MVIVIAWVQLEYRVNSLTLVESMNLFRVLSDNLENRVPNFAEDSCQLIHLDNHRCGYIYREQESKYSQVCSNSSVFSMLFISRFNETFFACFE